MSVSGVSSKSQASFLESEPDASNDAVTHAAGKIINAVEREYAQDLATLL